MATNAPLKKNTATTLYLEVRSQADPTTFKSAPTLAAGDWKFSVDGGAYANTNTTPTASGTLITVALLAAETNGDIVKLKAEDAAGAEWVGRVWTFYTSTKQIDDLSTLGGTAQTGDSFARLGAPAGASLAADVAAVQSDTDNIQTRIPAALVSGRIDASVGAMAANVMTAAAAASDFTTELQSGLSTLDAAGVRTAVGLASANLDTQLAAIDDVLDTEVAAIKAKTDNLPSDPADQSLIIAATDAILTAVGDVPTNAELTTALGTADDAVLTAIDALPTAVENADALLARNQQGGSNNAPTVATAVAGGLMLIDIAAGTLTVKHGDGTTAYTRTLSRTALDAITSAV
jgi:hypothetical protein